MVRNGPEIICGQSVIYIVHEQPEKERERTGAYMVDGTKPDAIFADLSA